MTTSVTMGLSGRTGEKQRSFMNVRLTSEIMLLRWVKSLPAMVALQREVEHELLCTCVQSMAISVILGLSGRTGEKQLSFMKHQNFLI